MKKAVGLLLCAACVAAGCSKDRAEHPATSSVARKKEKVVRSFWFPEVSRQWTRTIGKNLPAHMDNLPDGKASAAKKLIDGMADNLLEIITNRTEVEVHELVCQLDDVTNGLGYNLCGQYLWKLKYAFEFFKFPDVMDSFEQPPLNITRTISNYCHIASMVADMCWTKAGRCFQAEVIDYSQFKRLNYWSKTCKAKKWNSVQPIVDQLKQEWIEKRFDAPDCHLRIACDEIGEDAELDKTGLERPWSIRGRYDNPRIYFAVKAVGRYPKWLKGVVLDDEGRVYDPSKK